jgi:hypothetical protein
MNVFSSHFSKIYSAARRPAVRACFISPRARLDGGFSAQTSLKTLTIRQDCCGFLPRWTKNPLANPHSLRYETGSEEIWSDSRIPVPNISFFIGKSKMNFRFAQPARKLLRKETFCGTLKL